MQAGSHEELIRYLREFRTWGNAGEGYDYVGMLHLLGACLENLRKYASESELKELGDCLEAGQLLFLKKLAQRV